MGKVKRVWVWAAVFGLAAPAGAVRIERMAGLVSRGKLQTVEVAAEQVLIRFDPALSPADRAAALAGVGAKVLAELPSLGWTHVALPAGMPVAAGLSLVKGLSGVQAAEPNYIARLLKVPNDPQVPNQYHLNRIDAFAAWDYEVGTSSLVTVAVIDAGVDATQTELSPKLVGTSQFFDPDTGAPGDCPNQCGGCAAQCADQPPTPACNHATRVAGVAAAATNNGSEVAGISWGAKLISLKVINNNDCTSDCNCGTLATTVASAVDYARTSLQGQPGVGQVVVNMSLGAAGPCPGVLQTAVTNAYNAGIVLVAAAGNDGLDVNWPGNCIVNCPACQGTIAVGATDSNDNIASFSSPGSSLAANGVVAPGVSIFTTDLNNAVTGAATGTSFASPMVAGLAALIKAAQPGFTPDQVRNTIRNSADNIGQPPNLQGAGRINAFKALRLAVNGTLANFDGAQKAIAFPNPFRPSQHGMVTITVPNSIQGSNTTVKIYTMDGQFVRQLNGQTWDGKNTNGILVASGVYIFLIKTDSGMQRGRVAVIR